MSKTEEKIERLTLTAESISEDLNDALDVQSRLVASNMFLRYGDKACLSASGFVYSIAKAHEAALHWLLSEGWVAHTDASLAAPDEMAERRAARAAANEETDEVAVSAGSGQGYL